jgi:hypothetical protein
MNESNGWTKTLGGMPKAGDTATRDKTMSMQDIELFTQITGDRNPLHYDEALAKASMFGGLIVQGGVTTGILNALVAEDLPGPGTVRRPCTWATRSRAVSRSRQSAQTSQFAPFKSRSSIRRARCVSAARRRPIPRRSSNPERVQCH